jgi:hypothetical protein
MFNQLSDLKDTGVKPLRSIEPSGLVILGRKGRK